MTFRFRAEKNGSSRSYKTAEISNLRQIGSDLLTDIYSRHTDNGF